MSQSGFSLIEVTLAITIGLVITAGSVFAYNQINQSSRASNAKTMVGTIQGNIAMEKFRLGTPPPFSPGPSPSPRFGVAINQDSTGKAYAPQGTPGSSFPIEPISGINTVQRYRSDASPVPLKSNAPTPQWDNPIFASPIPAGYMSPMPSPYTKGGWLYDETTGAFRANLSNSDYPDQRPGSW